MNTIQVNIHTSSGIVPAYATPASAAFDLRSTIAASMAPGKRIVIPTGAFLDIPDGYCGQIWPRSGLAYHNGIEVLAGLIDSDYTGEIKAILRNGGDVPFLIEEGDRIAQMMFVKYAKADFREVSEIPSKSDHVGFGSTGHN